MNNGNYIHYKITFPKDKLLSQKDNPKFLLILRLARILNSMRFSHEVIVKNLNGDTPASGRQRATAFLLLCSLFYESFQSTKKYNCVYDDLEKEFNEFDYFKQGLLQLKSNSHRIELHNSLFKHVRDKILFHFDQDIIPEGLEKYISDVILPERIEFSASHTNETGDWYHSLADDLVFKYIEAITNEDIVNSAEMVLKVTSLSYEFIKSSDTLIAEVLKQMGGVVEQDKHE